MHVGFKSGEVTPPQFLAFNFTRKTGALGGFLLLFLVTL